MFALPLPSVEPPATPVAGKGDRGLYVLRGLRAVMLLLGLSMIIVGVAVDWLRPGASQGFGGAQVAVIVAGVALMASSFMLKLRPVRDLLLPLVRHPLKTTLVVVFSGVVSISVMEAALAFLGHRPLYARGSTAARLSLARWWQCDDLGCRFDPSHVREAPSPEDLVERPKAEIFFQRLAVVNSQGFHDDDEFVVSEGVGESFKILVLGDSFAFGFYAPLGQSWVESFETDLSRDRSVTLWNTGIPGAATVQEAAVLEHLFSDLRPDLVILGFYPGNDLDGNLYPAGAFYASETGRLISRYKVGPRLEPIEMTPGDAYHRATGIRLSSDAGPVAAALGRTRTGTLFMGRWARLVPELEWLWSRAARATPGSEAKQRHAALRTRELLAEMKAFVEQRGSRFLLLLIPSPHDVVQAGQRYRTGKAIVQDLKIETVEVTDRLTVQDYLPGDEHWHAGGHAKVGRRMAEVVRSVRP